MSNIGKIVRAVGPVVDIAFDDGHLPALNHPAGGGPGAGCGRADPQTGGGARRADL